MNSPYCPRPQRRRHRVAGILLAVLLVAAWLLAAGVLGGSGTATAASGSVGVPGAMVPVASTSHVVQPGDTLWSVARSLQPAGDVRPLVDRLARHTDGGQLRIGQRIPLP